MTRMQPLNYLLGRIIKTSDPIIVAACYSYVGADRRSNFEKILFATNKLKRQFAMALYTPDSVLQSLVACANQTIQLKIAKNPNCSAITLNRLAQQSVSKKLDVQIATHPRASQELLQRIYRKHLKSSAIITALCNNLSTPLVLLREIAKKASISQLKCIVGNPETDSDTLSHCFQYKDVYLQAEVVAHPNCPSELLQEAKVSKDALIRRKLTQNPLLSEGDLLGLLEDNDSRVRAAAIRRLNKIMMNELGIFCFDKSAQVRRCQARREKLPLAWFKGLAQDPEPWVRRLIARNITTPVEILCTLANDKIMMVRRGVVRNLNCPKVLIKKLAADTQPWVRAGIALRIDTPQSVLIALSKDNDIDVLSALGRNSSTPTDVLDKISQHPDKDVRRSVILNDSTPHSILHKLLNDPYPLNRLLLTNNKNLLGVDLMGLIEDPEPTVRFSSAMATMRHAYADS